MEIIDTFIAPDLGKTMPTGPLHLVTVQEHDKCFYAFDTTDVWTADGWLITAVASDGSTHHMRQGCKVILAKLSPETMLYYKPTPKTTYMLGK